MHRLSQVKLAARHSILNCCNTPVLLFVIFISGTATVHAAERVALVIGNGLYQKVQALPNPPRDAADVGRALERLNFKVTRLDNATAPEMRKAVIEFGRATEGSDMAVVFYAGHGMEVGGENWLIPTDAELRSDTDVENEAISLRSINLQVSKARQLGLVILDACRNNPFAAKMQRSLRTRAVTRGLASTEPSDNVLVAYAARDGTTANDGEGRNSPFTTALLHNIETPGLEISFLFRNVRDEVMTATKREQQPFVYGSLSKEAIYLKPAEAPKSAGKETPSDSVPAPAIVNAKVDQANLSRETPAQKSFGPDDARRVAEKAAELHMKLPEFAIGEVKGDVPLAYRRFVGVWASQIGFNGGKGRQSMLIVTDVASDGTVLGFHISGPPTKYSWQKTPGGAASFGVKFANETLQYKVGKSATIKARLDGDSAIIMQATNEEPGKAKSETSIIRLLPVWRLSQPFRNSGR
jgi:uncharacterized caspase-like protein